MVSIFRSHSPIGRFEERKKKAPQECAYTEASVDNSQKRRALFGQFVLPVTAEEIQYSSAFVLWQCVVNVIFGDWSLPSDGEELSEPPKCEAGNVGGVGVGISDTFRV
jgi:hypothetical protein